jgi:hypothetical protein
MPNMRTRNGSTGGNEMSAPIPEDLKILHALAVTGDVEIRHYEDGGWEVAYMPDGNNEWKLARLIERIAELEHDLAVEKDSLNKCIATLHTCDADYKALKAKVARLVAPVSDEEKKSHMHHDDWGVLCWYPSELNALIAARAQEKP